MSNKERKWYKLWWPWWRTSEVSLFAGLDWDDDDWEVLSSIGIDDEEIQEILEETYSGNLGHACNLVMVSTNYKVTAQDAGLIVNKLAEEYCEEHGIDLQEFLAVTASTPVEYFEPCSEASFDEEVSMVLGDLHADPADPPQTIGDLIKDHMAEKGRECQGIRPADKE